MDILKDLFDEKIISVINLFLDNPDKRYCLTDISNITKVNIATTFRILNKLISKGFIRTIVIGKVRIYQLERNEKTMALQKFLRGNKEDHLQVFIDEITSHPRIKKIVLESRDKRSAKILIIGEFLPVEKIKKAIDHIKSKSGFSISYVEISEAQYNGLKDFKNYSLDKKIIWERPKENK